MGDIFICKEPIAPLPYYIEGVSWNVYSLEELCYYIENHTYLLEKDFMNEELCTWIGKEVKNLKLAEQLREMKRMNEPLSEFISILLLECGYTPKDKITEIIRLIKEMEEKSDFECNKVRADGLFIKEKYLSCIYEYKTLLESHEAKEQKKELIGNIWHNLGTAYARLFLFREATDCYQTAFSYNQNLESIYACLMAYCLLKDEKGLKETAEKYQVDADRLQEIYDELKLAANNDVIKCFYDRLDEIAMMKKNNEKELYQEAISNIIFNWKEEYRRIGRL